MDKIIFFHPKNDFTGSTRILANVIESNFHNQVVFIVTLCSSEGFLSSLPNVRFIPIQKFALNGKKIPVFSALFECLSAFYLAWRYGRKCDVFYINTILPYYAAIIGRLYHKRIIYHVHEKFLVYSLNMRFAEYVFRHVQSKRIYVSRYLSKQYPSKKGCQEIVCYNKLSKSFIAKIKIVPIEKRNRNTILMITSLSKNKGLFTFIEVARLMPHRFFQLIISTNKYDIDNYVKCSLPTNLEIIPAKKDICPYLHSADLIVNLSIPSLCIETFGMTILEAMAYGVPAIVPNVGGPLELVINDYNGYCIDVTDIDSIIKTIDKALSKDNYELLATNALRRVCNFV